MCVFAFRIPFLGKLSFPTVTINKLFLHIELEFLRPDWKTHDGCGDNWCQKGEAAEEKLSTCSRKSHRNSEICTTYY